MRGAAEETSEIIEAFMECATKQQVVDTLAHFASRYFGCVTVYAVRGQVIEKVAAFCDVDDGPQSTPSGRMTIYKRCIESGRPYYGPIPLLDLNDPRMSTLMAILPDRCWVYPMAIGEQVDCLIYAEAPKATVALCTERYGLIIQKAIATLRRLLIAQLSTR